MQRPVTLAILASRTLADQETLLAVQRGRRIDRVRQIWPQTLEHRADAQAAYVPARARQPSEDRWRLPAAARAVAARLRTDSVPEPDTL